MSMIGTLFWFQILAIVSHAVLLYRDGYFLLKVSEIPPIIKICGIGKIAEPTLFCFDGNSNENQRHGCPESFCGITATTLGNYLTASFGEGNANFDNDCATIKLVEDKQIAIGSNAGNPKQGTCKWNLGEDGELLVNVTLSAGFTVEVENVKVYDSVKSSTAGNVEWHYIAGLIAAVLVFLQLLFELN